MAINAFSSFNITVSDGGTVPSINLTNKTYIDIGSGNVLKLSWGTPTATNNAVANYRLCIMVYDLVNLAYKPLYDYNIGNVNEFYLTSSMLSSIKQSSIKLRITIEAISKYGSTYNGTSNPATVYVGRGSGTYTKTTDGYVQPVFKRAIATAKLDYIALLGSEEKALTSTDGKAFMIKAAGVQDTTTGWALMQEFYSKDANGNWKTSDIEYEVLTDASGEVVTDSTNSIVYTL